MVKKRNAAPCCFFFNRMPPYIPHTRTHTEAQARRRSRALSNQVGAYRARAGPERKGGLYPTHAHTRTAGPAVYIINPSHTGWDATDEAENLLRARKLWILVHQLAAQPSDSWLYLSPVSSFSCGSYSTDKLDFEFLNSSLGNRTYNVQPRSS